MTAATGFPERIVCLTEETTETLYLLGEDWRIVGISGFTVRPPRARREKPRVSAFTSAHTGRILALKPDLVLGFSDLQADIAATLVRAGLEVHVFNHRSVADILRMIRTLGGMIGREGRARALADALGVRAQEGGDARLLAARARRAHREAGDPHDPPILAEQIECLGRLLGEAHDPLRKSCRRRHVTPHPAALYP